MMDSIAALAFGITSTSLGHTGGGIGAKVVHRTSVAAVVQVRSWASSTWPGPHRAMSSRTHSLQMVPASWLTC